MTWEILVIYGMIEHRVMAKRKAYYFSGSQTCASLNKELIINKQCWWDSLWCPSGPLQCCKFLSPSGPRLPDLGQGYLLLEKGSPGGNLKRPYRSLYLSHRTICSENGQVLKPITTQNGHPLSIRAINIWSGILQHWPLYLLFITRVKSQCSVILVANRKPKPHL